MWWTLKLWITNSLCLLTTSSTNYLNEIIKNLNNNGHMNTWRRWQNMLKNECRSLTNCISQNLKKENGVGTHCTIMFPSIHVFQCLVPPLFHGRITKKKPQVCVMLCVACRGHICLIMFHGLQGFLNYTYFQKGYQVH
jgi:hypothetical protein